MYLFHVARTADWEAARAAGSYEFSTLGRTLAQEGFIHASRESQWRDSLERHYAGVSDPLTLLVIDQDKVSAPVIEEAGPDGTAYPHIYGPLNTDAVISAVPVEAPLARTAAKASTGSAATAPTRAPGTPPANRESFTRIMLREIGFNLSLVLLAMVLSLALAYLAAAIWGPGLKLTGALVGLALGAVVGTVLYRRRAARADGPEA